ncbi:MAG: hypothetical protein HGB11_00960 [Chlorobiales bacterium]|nr:hypothetical protein [Chlorobiales bacterium]
MRDTSNKLNGRKWCVALLVSPGMLFLFAYLCIFFSVNLYLNSAIKAYLSNCSLTSGTETCRATAGSLDTDFWLTSLTIHDLKLKITTIGELENVPAGTKRELSFPSVTISGNWAQALVSLRSSDTEKFVVGYSSDQHLGTLPEKAFTTPVAIDVALIQASTAPIQLKSEIVQNNNPLSSIELFSGDERLNSMFVEVLTLLSREEL